LKIYRDAYIFTDYMIHVFLYLLTHCYQIKQLKCNGTYVAIEEPQWIVSLQNIVSCVLRINYGSRKLCLTP